MAGSKDVDQMPQALLICALAAVLAQPGLNLELKRINGSWDVPGRQQTQERAALTSQSNASLMVLFAVQITSPHEHIPEI